MTRSILITGCSKGIGFHAALMLKARGYRVFATARRQHDVEMLKNKGLEALVLNVDDSQSIRRAMEEVLQRTDGRLDAVFNNAGYAQPGAVEDVSRAAMRAQFETNVFGSLEVIHHVLPVMRKQGYGRIIQNSSVLGLISMPFRGAYNASKYAVEGLIDTLRLELYNTGIHAILIEPGPTISEFRESAHQVFLRTVDVDKSIHRDTYRKMEGHFFRNPHQATFFQSPEAVVKKLIHALESVRPKAHYYVGLPTYLFASLRRLLPARVLDSIIRVVCKKELS